MYRYTQMMVGTSLDISSTLASWLSSMADSSFLSRLRRISIKLLFGSKACASFLYFLSFIFWLLDLCAGPGIARNSTLTLASSLDEYISQVMWPAARVALCETGYI